MRCWSIAVIAGAMLLVESGADDRVEMRMREGTAAFERGAFPEAMAAWKEAAALGKLDGTSPRRADALLNLGQAYHALGQRRLAKEVLEEALTLDPPPERRTRIKSALGAVCTFSRADDQAEKLLRESLDESRQLADTALVAVILNDLGTLHAARGRASEAARAYEESAKLGGGSMHSVKAWANAAAASSEPSASAQMNRRALRTLAAQPASHEKASLLLTIGRTWLRQQQTAEALAAWKEAGQIALKLEIPLTRSYALGFLGELYETSGRFEDALKLTREAFALAQQTRSQDALFRWEWQKGRLFARLGNREEGIAAYQRAITHLGGLRHDIALGFGNANRGLSFRTAVGPLFFQLADLLLQRSADETDPAQVQASLRAARDTIESLKAAELIDYFQDDCVNELRSKTAGLEQISPTAAIIYLIPLPNRTELLLGLADGLRRFSMNVGEPELTAVIRAFRRNLETRTTYEHLKEGRQLFDWLIRPMESVFAQQGIDTLVFVPDGALRTIPLAALHDGERFLISRYAVAVTPGATLTDPRTVERKAARILLGGLSDPVQGYQSLSFVPQELETVRQLQGGTVLLNGNFRTEQVGDKFSDEQFSIVHFASHGRFDRDAQKTFVLTHDSKMTLDDLERFIQPSRLYGRPVELVTLSACQTAAGDDRAALGMAGVAVKSGARSAVASLWFVNDESSSALISRFYKNLWDEPNSSKAQAMQKAQLSLLETWEYRHPCYWAPYLVIGNWL